MRHFHRTQLLAPDVLAHADAFFPTIGLAPGATEARARTFTGAIGTVQLVVRPEGGHYTFVEANTDQMGESRLDRNVKKFFVRLHAAHEPRHRLEASY